MWNKQLMNIHLSATSMLCYQPPQPEEADIFPSQLSSPEVGLQDVQGLPGYAHRAKVGWKGDASELWRKGHIPLSY